MVVLRSFFVVALVVLLANVATGSFWLVVAATALALAAVARFNALWDEDPRLWGATLTTVGAPVLFVLLPMAWWYHARAGEWRQLLAPREVTMAELSRERPALPAYVVLSGATPAGNPLSGFYLGRDSKGHTTTVHYCRQPLGEAGWQRGELVPVVSNDCSYTGGERLRGWLQAPGSGGSFFRSNKIDVDGRVAFARAGVVVDPQRTLFLDACSPLGSMGKALLISAFSLIFALLLVGAFSAGFWPAPREESEPPRGSPYR